VTDNTQEDPFAEFDDWLENGPAGKWRYNYYVSSDDLSVEQRRVVAANAVLLLDREQWHERVDAFEAAGDNHRMVRSEIGNVPNAGFDSNVMPLRMVTGFLTIFASPVRFLSPVCNP